MFNNYVGYRKYGIWMLVLLCMCLLAACGTSAKANGLVNRAPTTTISAPTTTITTGGTTSATSTQGKASVGTTNPMVTPIQSNGIAPVEIDTPTPLAGGSPTSQQVVLKDRTLIIEGVSREIGVNADPVAITLTLTIKNTSDRAIQNRASFFQLIGMGGDFFGQTNSSDNFYGPIAAHTMRSGTITFQLPGAAITDLHLMYRSEVASGALLMPLKIQ